MWSGSVATIPSGWVLCDGSSGTPDLRNRFIIGAHSDVTGVANTTITGGNTVTGGSKDAIVVSHTHTFSASATTSGQSTGHTHTFSGNTGAMSANASHDHGIADPGHAHSLPSVFYQSFPNGFAGSGGAGQVTNSTGSAQTSITINAANTDHTHTYSGTTSAVSGDHTHSLSVSGTTASTGSSATNANLPPYYALAFIMKT
jgi:hypothetical protein